MKYFQALSDGRLATGPIRVSYLWHGQFYIAYRTHHDHPMFMPHSSSFPSQQDYGECQEITEEEALHFDPDLFADDAIWENYEEFKTHDAEQEALKKSSKKKG